MNTITKSKFIFENDVMEFESSISDFTDVCFHEFDEKSKKIKLKKKIEDLIGGQVVNHSERQAATHPSERGKQCLFDDNAINKFARKINLKAKQSWLESRFLTHKKVTLITLGIGGSFEGPKLLNESIGSSNLSKKIKHYFITGSDMKEFDSRVEKLDPKKTFFIVFSKSFTTIETIELFRKATTWSKDHNKFLFITSNPNEVKKYNCSGKNFDDDSIYTFDKTIGGRYSIWLDAISFIYGDAEFIKGGFLADQHILKSDAYFNFVKRLSFTDIWNHNTMKKNSRAVLTYAWPLRSLPNYIQQLEMESLGKHANPNSEFKKTGQVIFGGYGPTAQHSYFQLMHQGTNQICADIIASNEDKKRLCYVQAITQSKLLPNGKHDKEQDDTYAALLADRDGEKFKINGNVPLNLFLLNKIDAFSLGYLIATWEYRTFITAAMLEINPFDQFGVVAGKIYTSNYLAEKD
tara:strand:+ start:3482 stop:4873 length:1392 start_codon:yes stop_codon:yes gene_type:complete